MDEYLIRKKNRRIWITIIFTLAFLVITVILWEKRKPEFDDWDWLLGIAWYFGIIQFIWSREGSLEESQEMFFHPRLRKNVEAHLQELGLTIEKRTDKSTLLSIRTGRIFRNIVKLDCLSEYHGRIKSKGKYLKDLEKYRLQYRRFY